MKQIILFALLAGLIVSSCSYEEGSEEVNIEDSFVVSIPNYMDEDKEIFPGAMLQYANRFRNLYLVGNEVDPDTLGMDFDAFVTKEKVRLQSALDNGIVYDSLTLERQDLEGAKMVIYGKMNNEPIYYVLHTIKTDEAFYYLSIWTRGESGWSTYNAEMHQILDSFREI